MSITPRPVRIVPVWSARIDVNGNDDTVVLYRNDPRYDPPDVAVCRMKKGEAKKVLEELNR